MKRISLSLRSSLIIAVTSFMFSGKADAAIQTVPYVDVTQYLGAWYQISHIPLSFEGDCACSRQVLDLANNGSGRVSVWNSCNTKTPTGALREIRGFATNDDPTTNAKFTVDFGIPGKLGTYWVIGLGQNYEYAIVSEPTESSLYILSKTPTLDPVLYQEALAKAAAQTDTSRLVVTEQNGCTYP